MNITNRGFRLLSVILIVTLIVGFATPGRAEALEPLTIMAIAGAAVLVVVLVVYLIIANVHESQRRKAEGEPRYLACAESDIALRNCWAIPEPSGFEPVIVVPSATIAAATQSP